LSSARLAQAITNVIHSNSMRERAAKVGLRLKAERGVARAVALIDSYLSADYRKSEPPFDDRR
jgi:UDP:flavonoid glycosyltransferase YjiC (YdhE family)